MRIITKALAAGASRRHLFLVMLFFALCSACAGGRVLGIPRKAAADFLSCGETGFITGAKLPADFPEVLARLKELCFVHPAAPFYAGLLLEAAGEERSFFLFGAALESPSPPARREAAEKLTSLIMETTESPVKARDILGLLDSEDTRKKAETPLLTLRAACLYRMGRYDEAVELLSENPADEWGKALFLFASLKGVSARDERAETLKDEITAFLFESPPGESRRWAYREALGAEGLLDGGETAAIEAALAPGDYKTILAKLRSALKDGGVIFFRYPELMAELGRAYQYTQEAREEGAALFAAWERLFEKNAEPFALPPALLDADGAPGGFRGEFRPLTTLVESMSAEDLKERQFRILYYLGRITRAKEEYSASSGYFARAFGLAPDDLQADSCLWYTLMNAMVGDPAAAVPAVLDTMPRWKDLSYFDDVLDRLSNALAAERQWNVLLEIFSALEKRAPGVSLAQYAWILGRAAEEGYLRTEKSAANFFRAAFEAGGSLYYRIMAASKLDLRFDPLSGTGKDSAEKERDASRERERKDEGVFLLGFFECGAASLARPFIQASEKELSVSTLRKIAEALASSGRLKESLDLVSRYMNRGDYKTRREDLSLFYPRPFKKLVEKYAREAGLEPEVLYGLIHTESYFESAVVSRSGAVGLTQLMAPTAGEMAGRVVRQGGPDYRGEDGNIDLKEPEINIHIGSYYLGYLKEHMGNLMPALLAYNGGMGRMRRWLAGDRARGGLPPDLFLETVEYAETREYGRRVLAAAAVYGWLYYGTSMEAAAAGIYR